MNIPRNASSGRSGFTMVEIALCLAIIGFALVAIIGVLPTGLGVQKDNREETIINQDATVWMDLIRNGGQGMNDLTNYVLSVSNTATTYEYGAGPSPTPKGFRAFFFTYNLSLRDGSDFAPHIFLNSGTNIVGLLSIPKYVPINGGFISNYVVASVLSLSGAAVEKAPQKNDAILEAAFGYRLIPEIVSYVATDTNVFDFSPAATAGLTPAELQARIHRARALSNLTNNTHDIRLTFRWPLQPRGKVGNGRLTFRALAGGPLVLTPQTPIPNLEYPFYFIHSGSYGQPPRFPLP
jgi:type II secretory pathway pseudopilin PulG